MSMLSKIQEIKQEFEKSEDWEDRYRVLISWGRKLSSMDEEYKIEKFRIKGCQSQVWLYPEFKDQKVYFQADSDAMLVKGIIALLVKVYSGQTAQEILEDKSDFLKDLGITDHLSMNRSNGLAAMAKQIKMYALAFQALQAKG